MAKKFQKASFKGVPFFLETKSTATDVECKVEKKDYSIEIKQIDESNEDFYIITGYATKFFGIDTYGDQIRPGAYLETIAKNATGIPALFMHDSREMPVGMWFSMKEDDIGLLVQCRLPKSDTFVSGRLIPQIKAGSVDALSIGFRPTKVSFEEIDGEMIRILEGIDLREISFIIKGYQADSGALLTDLKRREDRTEDENIYNAMVEAKRHGCTDEVKKEIVEFYEEKGKLDPFDDDAVVSIEELKSLSKSNRVWAIRKLNLSAKASQHLAELLEIPKNLPEVGSEGVDGKSEDESASGEPIMDGENPVEDGNNTEEEESKATHNALDNLLATLNKTIN
jgi:HK97 family phage prohead protease